MGVVRLEREWNYWLPQWLKKMQRAKTPPPPKTALAAWFLLTQAAPRRTVSRASCARVTPFETRLGTCLLITGLVEGWYDIGPKVRGAPRAPPFRAANETRRVGPRP